MARKPQGPQALTGAERQARYRARHEGPAGGTAGGNGVRDDTTPSTNRGTHCPTGVALAGRGWRSLSPCRPSMPPGWRPCRRQPATAPPARPCRPSSISTWMRS